jgi:hypothetical protein
MSETLKPSPAVKKLRFGEMPDSLDETISSDLQGEVENKDHWLNNNPSRWHRVQRQRDRGIVLRLLNKNYPL